MLVNSLLIGLITYTAAVIYNLIIRRSLETVFFLGIKFLIYTTLMTLFLQLSYYLIKNYNLDSKSETDNKVKEEINSEVEEREAEESSEENQNFAESAVENEFENEEFSAFSPEEFDYQQNNNQ
jgi:predicted membrane protein